MNLLIIKNLHLTCAATSYVLFVLRGLWSLNESPIMQQRWIKIVPHLIDTLLLGTAILLAYGIGQYPIHDTWLTAKASALLLYIALGSVALKYGKNKSQRRYAWLAAQLVFTFIVLVALNHPRVIISY